MPLGFVHWRNAKKLRLILKYYTCNITLDPGSKSGVTLRCGTHFAGYAWFLQPPEWAVFRQGFGNVYSLMSYNVPPHGVVIEELDGRISKSTF